MKGTLGADNYKDGAIFTIKLPEDKKNKCPHRVEEKTILYVESDQEILNYTKSKFENIFFKTYSANDGKSALTLYNQFKEEIDVIITETELLNIDGFDLIKEIKQSSKNSIKAIALVNFKDSKSSYQYFDKVLEKPITIGELKHLVGKLTS